MEENYFDRLPAEVILHIFEKINDVKCLCICHSVSKRFAALVLQTRFISVPIHNSGHLGFSWPPKTRKFLGNFCCVESVIIQFPPRVEQQGCPPLLRWKSDSSSFNLVYAKSRIDDTTGIEATCESKVEYYLAVILPIIRHMFHFCCRFAYTKDLLDLFPYLKNIGAVESRELGSVVWEEDIARRTKEKLLKDFCVKLWTAPLVKLPCSGCVVEDAILISIREIEASHELACFEEDEHRELAATMMKEYPCKQVPCMPRVDLVQAESETPFLIDSVITGLRFRC